MQLATMFTIASSSRRVSYRRYRHFGSLLRLPSADGVSIIPKVTAERGVGGCRITEAPAEVENLLGEEIETPGTPGTPSSDCVHGILSAFAPVFQVFQVFRVYPPSLARRSRFEAIGGIAGGRVASCRADPKVPVNAVPPSL